MSLYQCLSCLGVYQDPQPDGSYYYHTCPPAGMDLGGGLIERPDARDENLVVGGPGEAPRIIAEGRGRRELSEAEASEYWEALRRLAAPAERPGVLARLAARLGIGGGTRIRDKLVGHKAAEKEG